MGRNPPRRPSRACPDFSHAWPRTGSSPTLRRIADRTGSAATNQNINGNQTKPNPHRIGKLGDRALHALEIINPKPLEIDGLWVGISKKTEANPRFAPFISMSRAMLLELHQPDTGVLHPVPHPFCPTLSWAVPWSFPPSPRILLQISPPVEDPLGEFLTPHRFRRKRNHQKQSTIAV
jgi:hypothetical protein